MVRHVRHLGMGISYHDPTNSPEPKGDIAHGMVPDGNARNESLSRVGGNCFDVLAFGRRPDSADQGVLFKIPAKSTARISARSVDEVSLAMDRK
jgi:hypothetical protein